MTSQLTRSSLRPNPPGTRASLWAGTVIAVIMLAAALVWLVAPQLGPYADSPAPVQLLTGTAGAGPVSAAAVQAALGVVASAVGIAALFGLMRPGALLAVIGIVCGGITAVGFVGFNGIATAGYLLASTLPVLVIITVIFACRRPLIGGIVVAAVLALLAFVFFGPTPIPQFYEMAAVAFVDDLVELSATVLSTLFAGVWILCGALLLTRDPGRFGAFVSRHRIVITVLAACCALPYVIARASWLTPWPLFGGSAIEEYGSTVLATGLMLGAAVLAGGVLTLGLILPWGSRLPRWLPRIGGRPVPVALAVVPASIVSVLFTAGGAEALLMTFAQSGAVAVGELALVLVLPFWLWGPLLALATWGYVLHRAATPPASEHRDGARGSVASSAFGRNGVA